MSGTGNANVILEKDKSTKCTVNLHGATIVSWVSSGMERLFVSKEAIFDDKTPIMGGVPIVFPKFAAWGEKPFHGFARICRWDVEKEPHRTENGDVRIVLKLVDTAFTRQFWNYKFTLGYEVILGDARLESNITVRNVDSKPFSFDLLLHTYFLLDDVTGIEISGFKGCTYFDKTQNFIEVVEERDPITVRKYNDAVYKGTDKVHVISNARSGQGIRMTKINYPDTVVWNPWEDTVKDFSDLDEAEYRKFVCVEAGHVVEPAVLASGGSWKCSQVLEIC